MRFLPAVILGPFIPVFLQEVMGFPAVIVGFAVLPSALAMVLLTGDGGRLLDRRGPVNIMNLASTDPRCTIFGRTDFGNGACALIQFLENGNLLFNSVGRPFRVALVED